MRGLRVIRHCVLPQSTSLLVCILLCIGAVATPPSLKPSVAVAHARAVVQPADQLTATKAPEIKFARPVAVTKVDCTAEPCIALSFDDGPNRATTSQILAILEQQKVKASFFIVGSRVPGNEDLLRRMNADGFDIGNHSWSHPNFTKLTDQAVMQQVGWTQAVIEAAGVPAPTLFRPPYGALTPAQRAEIKLQVTMWNEDPRDWAAASAAQVEQAVLGSAQPGGVVDMHDIYEKTAEALPTIIQQLKQRGYHFVTVSELIKSRDHQPSEPFYGYHFGNLPATPAPPPQTAPSSTSNQSGQAAAASLQVSSAPPSISDIPPQQPPTF